MGTGTRQKVLEQDRGRHDVFAEVDEKNAEERKVLQAT